MLSKCPYCQAENDKTDYGIRQCPDCGGRFHLSPKGTTVFNRKEIWTLCAIATAILALILMVINQIFGSGFNDMDRIKNFCFGIGFFWLASSEFLTGWFAGKLVVRHITLTKKSHMELFLFYLFFLGFLALASLGAGILTIFGVIR